MIPIRLEFQAFGPYPDRQEINFAALRRTGLFLIRGDTGSGKTVILDAITYALYGRSSGGARGDLTAMRCQQAAEQTRTQIIFEWQTATGLQVRFTRALHPRKKRNGQIEYCPQQDALFRNAAGDWEPYFENPHQRDVEQLAAELTGLQYDQFRQVVILPQGQFERLLVATSEEKEKLLTSLFGAAEWGKAAVLLSDQANQLQRETEQLAQKQQAILNEHDCADGSALQARITAAGAECQTVQREIEALQQQAQQAQQAVAQATALEQQFLQAAEVDAQLHRLAERSSWAEQARSRLRLSGLSVLYQNWRTTNEQVQQAQGEHLFLIGQQNAEQRALQDVQAENALIQEQIRTCEVRGQRLQALQLDLQRLEEKEKGALQCARLLGTIERIKREQMQHQQDYAQASEKAAEISERYLHQIRYELALLLEADQPCPVCGSRTHPMPAPQPAGRVDRQAIDQCNEQVTQAARVLAADETQLTALHEQIDAIQQTIHADGRYEHEQLASVQDAVEDAKACILYAEQLRSKAEQLTPSIAQHQHRVESLQKQIQAAALTAARLEEGLRQLTGQLQDADPDGSLRQQLDALPQTEDLDTLRDTLNEYEQQCTEARALQAALQEQLAGQARPDLATLQAEARAQAAICTAQERRAAVLARDLEQLRGALARYEALSARLAEQRGQTDRALAFARLLRGSTGVSLQRYVLGAMLSAVTAEANQLLARVHDGRYQIYRTLETTGSVRKAGLELEVLDRRTAQRRSVVSLSGGEKFLVALALSIGLSAVVQAQSGAARLGAIFIDEGFGTLDQASLQDALSVLAAIRNTHGLVGIISHVSLLRESIHAGIRVDKRAEGSRLTVFYDG